MYCSVSVTTMWIFPARSKRKMWPSKSRKIIRNHSASKSHKRTQGCSARRGAICGETCRRSDGSSFSLAPGLYSSHSERAKSKLRENSNNDFRVGDSKFVSSVECTRAEVCPYLLSISSTSLSCHLSRTKRKTRLRFSRIAKVVSSRLSHLLNNRFGGQTFVSTAPVAKYDRLSEFLTRFKEAEFCRRSSQQYALSRRSEVE